MNKIQILGFDKIVAQTLRQFIKDNVEGLIPVGGGMEQALTQDLSEHIILVEEDFFMSKQWEPLPFSLYLVFSSKKYPTEELLMHGADYVQFFNFFNTEDINDFVIIMLAASRLLDKLNIRHQSWYPKKSQYSLFNSGAVFDQENLTLTFKSGMQHDLSKTELKFLTSLLENANKKIERDQVLFDVYGPNFDRTSRSIDQYKLRLNKTFFKGAGVKPITTIHGIGYKFIDETCSETRQVKSVQCE